MLVNAQAHGCLCIVGRQNALPILGVVFLQAVYPPLRVVKTRQRVVVCGCHQGLTLAQKAAQTRIHKAGLTLQPCTLGRFNGLVDQGEGLVRGLLRVPSQRQGGAQQRIHLGRGGFGGQLLAQHLGAPQLAQHLEQQSLHPRAQPHGHCRQGRIAGLPGKNHLQALRDCSQLLPQRDGRRCRCSIAWGRKNLSRHAQGCISNAASF